MMNMATMNIKISSLIHYVARKNYKKKEIFENKIY